MPDWSPPPALDTAAGGIRGALGGTRLFDRPEHAEKRAAIEAFLARPGKLGVEIGFDHGMKFLDHARRWPEHLWLGVEIRKRQVAVVAPHAPDNCLLLHLDARTLLSALIPAERVSWIYILFPTPTDNPRHLLLSPTLVELAARALAPDGVLHLATDVSGMYTHAAELLAGWPEAPEPPLGPVLSRRERVCARDALPVYRLTRGRP